ncbi:MAG: dihydroorotase [Alphaproteobacteria bacterium]
MASVASVVSRGRMALTNARLLCSATGLDRMGSVLVEDGAIVDIGDFAPGEMGEDIEVYDCGGLILTPGFFDLRVRAGEPGEPEKEDISSAARAAAAGGITSLALMPDTSPVIDDAGGLAYVAGRARRERSAKIYSWATITRGARGEELSDIGLLDEVGAIGFTDGDMPVVDAHLLSRAMRYGRAFGVLFSERPEDVSLAGNGVMNGGDLSGRLGLAGISPFAELIGLERDLRLVEMTGARFHVSQVSTAGSVEALRLAKSRGLAVTADTSPQYFLKTEVEVEGYRTFARLTPPLRLESDRVAVESAVVDGTIDAIVSAHSPQDQESKRVPFSEARAGIVGLETLFALSWGLVVGGKMDALSLLRRLGSGPAEIVGHRKALERGCAADFALLDGEERWRIDSGNFRSRSRNTLFDGEEVVGRVVRTYVDGRLVYNIT